MFTQLAFKTLMLVGHITTITTYGQSRRYSIVFVTQMSPFYHGENHREIVIVSGNRVLAFHHSTFIAKYPRKECFFLLSSYQLIRKRAALCRIHSINVVLIVQRQSHLNVGSYI